MSKLILGGDKFYKMEWGELQNACVGLARPSLNWGLEMFPETLKDKGPPSTPTRHSRDRSSMFKGSDASQDNKPREMRARDVTR